MSASAATRLSPDGPDDPDGPDGPDGQAPRLVPDGSAWDAVVVGAGAAGLTAAWELSRAGARTLLVEAGPEVGGLVRAGTVAGVRVDLGAESLALRGESVAQAVAELGLELVGPAGGRSCLVLPDPGTQGSSWRAHPFPRDSYLGIPADPLAQDVVSVIGLDAALRASRDAELPAGLGTGPQDPADLGSLVRARMGSGVLERLVDPIVTGIHGSPASVLAAQAVAPGLREATARLGSLQAAVAEVVAGRSRRAGGAAALVPRGGLFRLTEELRRAVEASGGRVATGTVVRGLRRERPGGGDGAWSVGLAPAAPGDAPLGTVRCGAVVLACPMAEALRLLGGLDGAVDVAGIEATAGARVTRLIVVARAAGLDSAPLGPGALVADGSAPAGEGGGTRVTALTHLSVKWPWIAQELREAHGEHVHALRLSYGRAGAVGRPEAAVAGTRHAGPAPEAGRERGETSGEPVGLPRALADVELLTGVRIASSEVIDSTLVTWQGRPPPATPERRERLARLESEARAVPGLAVTGEWVAGTGISSVITHARKRAATLTGAPGAPVG
ncbi:protoporphyrinogen/coproporphyrinogen oxidase [Actinomyces howellii]|uniref:Protoporphyrinogen oxidase n=1 Tax=Actinomyces howellii TaxID=52771 RepID=A0A3S4R1P3_9ACTO|nr:FAD-dependent oxidoreductase [Actinomyces howellii]VEG29108.1 Protoporphyrinogen oxidase [Actinomyces howellii]